MKAQEQQDSEEEDTEANKKDELEDEVEDKDETSKQDEMKEESKEVKKSAKSEQRRSNDKAKNSERKGFKVEVSDVLDGPNGTPYDETNPLTLEDEFWLKLNWSLDNNHNYQPGDSESIQLPKEVVLLEAITGAELKDEFGQVIATYDVDLDEKVTLTFTDYVTEQSEVSGWIELALELDKDNVQEEDGKIKVSPIDEEGYLEIPFNRGDINKTVEKQGKPNRSYNADEIEWTVTINKHGDQLNDVIVEDLLPKGTEYKEGSLKVEKQRTSVNGTPIGSKKEVQVNPNIKDQTLSVPLGDIQEIYTITYTTSVTDMDKKKFKNNVTFKDDTLEDVSSHATVTINRGDPLKKGGVGGAGAYDPKTGIITWYLEFNYDQKIYTM